MPEALESQGPLNDDVMGRFLEKLINAPDVKPLLSDEHFSVDGTLLARTIHRPHHQALARVLALQSPAGNGLKVILAASSSASRPTAPAVTLMLCWPVNPMFTRPNRATGAMCSWKTAML